MAPWRSIVVALALLVGTGASAATQLELARSQAAQSRQVVMDARRQQMALRGELSQVSARIEALKAKGQTFLASPELDSELRKSQDLSASLTELAQTVSSAESTSQASALALLNALNDELSRLRKALDASQNRDQRKLLIADLKRLRDERDSLRGQLPASAIPALQTAQTDDPDELLEQADALRDSEDKLRAQMKTLQSRISEAREEKELDRRIDDFSRDESMFDDADRRLRVTKEKSQELHVQRAPPLSNNDSSTSRDQTMSASAPGAGNFTPSGGGSQQGDSNNPTPGVPNDLNTSNVAHASDALPVVGQVKPNRDNGSDVESLEAQLARLAKQADELKARADSLEAKAKQ
ncbi:MAG: TetR family transcriptional regulator [Myxococcaceae bacterium]